MQHTPLTDIRFARLLSVVLFSLWSCELRGQTSVNTIINPGFEVGTPGIPIASPWTQIAGLGPMYVTSGSGLSPGDPTSAASGNYFLTANRLAPEPDDTIGNNNRGVFQDIDLAPFASEIDLGARQLELSFAYNDNDPNDTAVVSYSFLNGGGSPIGSAYTFTANSGGTGTWALGSLLGEIPIGAGTMRLELRTTFNNVGTARNVSYDSISANILPPAPPSPPSGLVNGNLIQFDGSGAWTWYSDERAVVDPNNGHVLVNSVGFAPSYPSGGGVDVVDFNPETGRRTRTPLSTIQVDDHNNGALMVLPDGRYLAMYANHGNNGGLGDEFSRWRRSVNPGDSTAWTAERTFNWFNAVPGANQTGNPDAANASYHNLFYLSEENQVYDISRSYGQLSINGASQNMPNIVRYDMATNSVVWAGQVLQSEAQGYSAYPKYVSNGVNRIYFTTTETHPRNYNNSIFAGYIQNGQTFDMLGNVIDNDLFDNGTAAGGSGFVPDVTDFTVVQQADALGEGHNRLWTVDMNLDAGGDPMALYISRWNPDGSTSAGSTTNPIDHRLHFAHWNEQAQRWDYHEVARMGNRLYRGADLSEQDYTGNAALVPGDPSIIYVSTPYDPRDPSGATFTSSYEIYRGNTEDGGATWDWTAITENSVVDNLRPIVPEPVGGVRTVLWFRGSYTTAHNINAAVVGIVERSDQEMGLVNYVDANSSNTRYANDATLQTSAPSENNGPLDNLWHARSGVGNGGSVFASSDIGFENVPMLKTTIDGATLEDGLYDIFAYFWSDDDEDWRLMAGLESNNLIDFRKYGSQHAEADQFENIETVSANSNDVLLYRVYLGRTEVTDGTDINVFIDDWQSLSGGAIRTWFDGVGYSLVSPKTPELAGDFNLDGIVDTADYTLWRDHLGDPTEASINYRGDGSNGVDDADFSFWKLHFGDSVEGSAGSLGGIVPEPAHIMMLIQILMTLSARRSI
jgi:hypothetical protein